MENYTAFMKELETGKIDVLQDGNEPEYSYRYVMEELITNNNNDSDMCNACLVRQLELLEGACGQVLCTCNDTIDFNYLEPMSATEIVVSESLPIHAQVAKKAPVINVTDYPSPVKKTPTKRRQTTMEECTIRKRLKMEETSPVRSPTPPLNLKRSPSPSVFSDISSTLSPMEPRYQNYLTIGTPEKSSLQQLTGKIAMGQTEDGTPTTSQVSRSLMDLLSQNLMWEDASKDTSVSDILHSPILFPQLDLSGLKFADPTNPATPVNVLQEDTRIEIPAECADIPPPSNSSKTISTWQTLLRTSKRGSAKERRRLENRLKKTLNLLEKPRKDSNNASKPTAFSTNNKDLLIQYIVENNISCDEEYAKYLTDPELCRIERKVPSSMLRSIKELWYGQVIANRDNLTFAQRINNSTIEPEIKGPLLTWLESIALSNYETIEQLITRLVNVLLEKHTKKRGIVLLGESDSGKSTLANIFTSYYERSEIGFFTTPGRLTSQFWLQKLPDKNFYRGDEIVLEMIELMQKFKQLTENYSNLETDVKYHAPKRIAPKPTIVTCNGNSPVDFYMHMQQEKLFITAANLYIWVHHLAK